VNINKKFLILGGMTLCLFILLVVYGVVNIWYKESKNSFYESASVIFDIEALKGLYSQNDLDNRIKELINKRGLTPQLKYTKNSATIGEYKISGADPLIGWDFMKDVLSKGYKVDSFEITQNPDHRIDIYLKVQF